LEAASGGRGGKTQEFRFEKNSLLQDGIPVFTGMTCGVAQPVIPAKADPERKPFGAGSVRLEKLCRLFSVDRDQPGRISIREIAPDDTDQLSVGIFQVAHGVVVGNPSIPATPHRPGDLDRVYACVVRLKQAMVVTLVIEKSQPRLGFSMQEKGSIHHHIGTRRSGRGGISIESRDHAASGEPDNYEEKGEESHDQSCSIKVQD
jgi:hypothetical protein